MNIRREILLGRLVPYTQVSPEAPLTPLALPSAAVLCPSSTDRCPPVMAST